MLLIESSTTRAGEPHERICGHALTTLRASGVRFLMGGAFALTHHTGIVRTTKDLDLFVAPSDVERTLACFDRLDFETELPFPHWLAKARLGPFFVDVIFSSGNGVARVDDEWFQYASDTSLYGVPVGVVPAEELVWSKAFVMERERYDGADVAHLLRHRGLDMDWPRVLRRFGSYRAVLLSHLVLFHFTYSDAARYLPDGLLEELMDGLRLTTGPDDGPPVCRGALLTRQQFLTDIWDTGYEDGRLVDRTMSEADIERWTAAIEVSGRQRGPRGRHGDL
jgi:hypothetical protein